MIPPPHHHRECFKTKKKQNTVHMNRQKENVNGDYMTLNTMIDSYVRSNKHPDLRLNHLLCTHIFFNETHFLGRQSEN